MISRDAVRMALQVPLRNPGRSFLTALGLAIGVGAFIAMVSFGRGARSSVVSQFETLGSNLLRVKPNRDPNNPRGQNLTMADVEALRRESTAIDFAVPLGLRSLEVVHGGRRYRTSVRGTTPEFTKTREEGVSAGGLFDEADMKSNAKVCLIGATVVNELFPNGTDPLGAVITVGETLPCRVIGLLSTQGANLSGTDLDDRIILPLTTFEVHFGLLQGLSTIEVRPKDRSLLPVARQEIIDILRRSHRIDPETGIDDFNIVSPDEVTRVAEQISGILTALLAGIAGVSLLVGGIGIMNIQLVSVAERTHEIGIRAAIGASPDQIMRQFLAEAVVLATLGSLAGVALGVGSAIAVAGQLGWPSATSPDIVLGSMAFGVLIGTVFGYIPAKRAASLDPIEALRRE